MDKVNDLLVGVCGCGEFIKVNWTDEFASGFWVRKENLSVNVQTQLFVAKEVPGRVPMAHCDECVSKIISGQVSALGVCRTKQGVEVIYTQSQLIASKGA